MTGQAPTVRLAAIGLRGVPNVIGGIETHCRLLYPMIARDMPEMAITLLARRRYLDTPSFRYRGVEVRGLRSPRGAASETLIHSLSALLYARFVLRADIVHLHGIGPGFFAPLARLMGMKVVVTDHAADFLRPKWGAPGRAFLKLGEAFAARYAHRLVCVSEALRHDLLTRHPRAAHNSLTIRHGIGLADSDPAEDAALLAPLGLAPGEYLLAVNRIDGTKRLEDLIAAHRDAPAGTLPLVIVGASIGDPAYEQRLRDSAGPGVVFPGYCIGPLLTALYRRAALFIHPSAMEGFGLVVLEALSQGTPVAVSDIAPHREFGLPSDAFFPVGDIAAIRATMIAAKPRHTSWRPAAAIAAAHSAVRSAAAHVAIFRALAGIADPGQPQPTRRQPRRAVGRQRSNASQ